MILHGFNASKEMPLLTDLSAQLNSRGIATVLFDFNGHGKSEGSFLDMTIPNETEDALSASVHIKICPKRRSHTPKLRMINADVAANV